MKHFFVFFCITVCFLQAQASKFVYRFHTERKTKLMHILDSEIWKQADVPPEIQALVTFVFANRHFPSEPCQSDENRRNADLDNFILVGDEKYAVVGATLILVQIIHEYCRYRCYLQKSCDIGRKNLHSRKCILNLSFSEPVMN